MDILEWLQLDWVAWYPTTMAVLLTIFWVIFMVASTIHTTRNSLSDIPGPPLATYTRLWMLLALFSEDCARWYLEVNEKYGKNYSTMLHRFTH